MKCNSQAPYFYSAYTKAPTCAQEAQKCKVANFFADAGSAMNPYARAYVVSQTYTNCAAPECALHNGTFFNDLYMPYANISK